MRRSVMSIIVVVAVLFLFNPLLMAGSGSGGSTESGTSQQIVKVLLEQTTSAGISLCGPDNYWDNISVQNGLASIHYDSGTVEAGTYILRFTGFNQNGNSTVAGATEVSLGVGDEINIAIDLLHGWSIYVKIYLANANAGAQAEITYKTSGGSGSYRGEIKQDEQGSYIDAWLPMDAKGPATIKSGVNQYSLDISPASLLSYLSRGYAVIKDYSKKSRISGLQAQIYAGKVYPTDFPGMSITEAVASVPENTKIRLIGDGFFNEAVKLPAKNITIEADPSLNCWISSDSEATIDIIPGNGGWVVLKYIQVQNYNYSGKGAAIRKLGNADLDLFNVVLRTGNGNTAIRGNASGLWFHNLTLLGDKAGTAFDLTGSSIGSIFKSFVMNYGRLFANVSLPGNGNLIWNIGETSGLEYWQNTAVKDPKLMYESDPYPGLNSPLLLPDGSYIGAIVPTKRN